MKFFARENPPLSLSLSLFPEALAPRSGKQTAEFDSVRRCGIAESAPSPDYIRLLFFRDRCFFDPECKSRCEGSRIARVAPVGAAEPRV